MYLWLNQGTTNLENGDFVRKDASLFAARVAWARATVADSTQRTDLEPLEFGDVGEQSLGRGYELGDIASVRYATGGIPGDDVLLSDAGAFATALGDLYRAHAKASLPFEVPELVDIEDAAEDAAGKKRPPRGKGFRLSKEERDLIETRAVNVAAAYYKADGWKVKKKGAPYHLELKRDGEKWTVEVKGTTSMGEAVPLTRGEVEHHANAYPNNALVVVRGIVLDKSTSPPKASGGTLFEEQPWNIDGDALKVISYHYTCPTGLYDPSRGVAAEDRRRRLHAECIGERGRRKMRKERDSGVSGCSAEPFHLWVDCRLRSGGVGDPVDVELEEIVCAIPTRRPKVLANPIVRRRDHRSESADPDVAAVAIVGLCAVDRPKALVSSRAHRGAGACGGG